MPSCISFANTCPSSGDSEQVLLSKILQAINSGSGGLAGVSSISVDGGPPQTGAVSFTTSSGVTSVQGDPGPAVSLDTSEIPELTNLYFTEPRVLATDLAGFAAALGAITAADTVLTAFGKTQGRLAALEAGTSGPFLLKAGDTGTGAFLFTPSVVDVVPLTLTSAVGSATTSSAFVVNGGATNRLTIRNDGRFILAGRILATSTDVLGNTLNFSDAGTNNAPILLALGHTSTAGLGTAAAGFGVMLDFNLDSTTTLATRATRQTVAWTDATHATRTASTTFFAFTGGSETIQLTLTNNQVQGGDGTVSLPTFTTRNDPNTGRFFSAADTIVDVTGGVARMTITSAGDVGIGVSVPEKRLHVVGDFAPILTNNNSYYATKTFAGVATAIFGVDTSDITSLFSAGSGFQFKNAAGNLILFRILNTGFVGVGPSATPSANLDINNSTTPTKLYVYETTDGAASPANYSRSIVQPQAGNHLIRTEAAGTGTLRTLQVGTGPATGMNIAGVNTIIHGGQSTGSATGGSLLFQVSAAGGAGAGINALATVITIASDGLSTFLSNRVGGGFVVQNNNVAGYSDFSFNNNAGVYKATAGYGNASAGIAAFADTFHFATDGVPIVFSTDNTNARLTISTAGVFTFADASNFAFNATTGTKIGTATTQKLAFYNATPIVQGASVADASGGAVIDSEARTAINALISRIEALGLIATV